MRSKTSCLFDTNLLSELTLPRPNPSVVRFMMQAGDAYISVISIHEMTFGLGLMERNSKRARHLKAKIDELMQAYTSSTLSVSHECARIAADLRISAQNAGRALSFGDAVIAATALEHHLQLATRNTKDFEFLAIDCVNPWQED